MISSPMSQCSLLFTAYEEPAELAMQHGEAEAAGPAEKAPAETNMISDARDTSNDVDQVRIQLIYLMWSYHDMLNGPCKMPLALAGTLPCGSSQ